MDIPKILAKNQLYYFLSNLGKNLYFLRKQKKLRQAQIQDCLGFSRTTWSNYENAVSEPSIEGLIRIANYFGISLDNLILSDLETVLKTDKKNMPVNPPYTAHEKFPFAANESGLSHIMEELNKLKEEINLLKDSGKKRS